MYGASHSEDARRDRCADLGGLSSDIGVQRPTGASDRPQQPARDTTLRLAGDEEVHTQVTTKQVKQLDRVIIRFAGDSGDGMQLTGDRFTQESAAFGNDLSTLPNFPAEIRAPQGTLPGVSSFQVHFADHDILTPGDAPDVLVAMNPAALRANLGDLPAGATIIVDSHDFSARNLTKAGYTGRRWTTSRWRRTPCTRWT